MLILKFVDTIPTKLPNIIRSALEGPTIVPAPPINLLYQSSRPLLVGAESGKLPSYKIKG